MMQVPTVVELLRLRAQEKPGAVTYTFLEDGVCTREMGRGALDHKARAIGAWLQDHGARGQRVLLLYPPSLEFLEGFFGCLYGGSVAVPVYPPNPARLDRDLGKLLRIAEDSSAVTVLTTGFVLEMVQPLLEQAPGLAKMSWVATDALEDGLASAWRAPEPDGRSLAFLQYTSGSTGAPKGVMLSHRNLMSNLELIHRCFETTPESRGVFWLPLYHDMGLIGGVLETLYCGAESALMSPLDFLRSPFLWLEAVSRLRGSISGAPNFAYSLCVRKVTPEQRETLDLSCWTLAFNGAEPIVPETLERFAETFAPCGFRREALYPCYGLAEATLIVSGGPKAAPPVIQSVKAEALRHRRVEVAAQGEAGSQRLVGCGVLPASQLVLIVDSEEHVQRAPDCVGEIWVSGGSVAEGYWGKPELSSAFQARLASGEGPFLRTGDLGFIRDGVLFVVGRLKDLIIVAGRNHYPQDIELTLERSHPGIRSGCSAAFSIPLDGEEQLVLVAEIERRREGEPPLPEQDVITAIRRAVSEQHELRAHAIRLVKAGSLPKTSSGKIQRFACRAEFLDGKL
jgi:acyl-CoA synthetase (AMP-forming)/AMP-acid ligase II